MIQRLVVLASGNGTNLQAIIDACANQEIAAKVAAVVSNKPNAYALERARSAGIPASVQVDAGFNDRQSYDRELAAAVKQYQPDWIVLAGWMRLLSAVFLNQFPQQVINLHPALPGVLPGIKAIEKAFAAFQAGELSHTGVMVHLVPDEGIDDGPVLASEIVPIYPTDNLATLSERVHAAERNLLVATLRKLTNHS